MTGVQTCALPISFIADEIKDDATIKPGDLRVVERSARKYTPGALLAYFVMIKLDEKTPNTDHGWIYGVIDNEGQVQAAGNIEVCASCHAHASHDRVFGPST